MPDRTVRDFPLFELQLVALPHELIPLHVFEERYKRMFAVCLEGESEFGIVWFREGLTKQVGCACEITEVLERMDDGRLNGLTREPAPIPNRRAPGRPAVPPAARSSSSQTSRDPDSAAASAAHRAYADLVVQATDNEPTRRFPSKRFEMAATVRSPRPSRPSTALRERADALLTGCSRRHERWTSRPRTRASAVPACPLDDLTRLARGRRRSIA